MSITMNRNGTRNDDKGAVIAAGIGILISLLFYPPVAKSTPVNTPETYDKITNKSAEFSLTGLEEVSPFPLETDNLQPESRPEWIEIEDFGPMIVTCYGPARNGNGFPLTNHVSRWFGRTRVDTGFTVQDALSWASELGLDGICAASPGPSGLYSRHRDDNPAIVEIEGHGRYLVVDRMSSALWNRLDIWVPDPWPGGTLFSHPCAVREIQRVEIEVDTYGYW